MKERRKGREREGEKEKERNVNAEKYTDSTGKTFLFNI